LYFRIWVHTWLVMHSHAVLSVVQVYPSLWSWVWHNWVVLAYNFNIVILVLIIGESCIGAFLLILLLQVYPCCYLALSFYSYTYWVPTISVPNIAISPYYSNLLLRRRGWTGILRRGVLGYVLPRLTFLWCYGVFHCFIPLRVIIAFRHTIYVIIIILYSWHLVICEPFWLYVWNNWSWVMHTMSTWFWCKNRVWHFILVNSHNKVLKYVEMYIACVLCLHGVSEMVISDRGM
jgi:hypothetical protein